NPAAIALDFSQMSSLAGTSTATTESQNGYGQGTLANITIGQDGTVTGAFTNGQQQTLAQIALATFQNEEGLTRIGNSQFQQTANSGLPQINVAGTGKLGFIVSGSLEESNVSLADQFVKMILAQRAFQANSKSITTADQDLQVVISLEQ
ncbi:MAG: flagellar hook-basal body complex protein, partial [Candidatus Eremiobacteraeota bacterium]|nr:flagellar hook-basal body complex protein [Candidatus Eremiobacteraeota bacterium]